MLREGRLHCRLPVKLLGTEHAIAALIAATGAGFDGAKKTKARKNADLFCVVPPIGPLSNQMI